MTKLLRWRWWAALGLLAVVAGLLPGVQRAAVPDNALTVWFLETDPQLEAYRDFQRTFGNDEVIVLHVQETEHPGGVFSAAALDRITRLSRDLESIDGVRQVHSIVSAKDAFDTDEGLTFRSLVPKPRPEDPSALAAIAARAGENPMFRDRLVTRDGQQAMLWIEMAVMDDIDARRDAIVAAVRATASRHLESRPHAMGGIGVIYSRLNVITQHDFGLFVGLGYGLMFLMMWWVFRSVRLVAAAMGVICVGTLVALGVYGTAGHQLNMVTVVLPTLIIVLGIADAVHFPAAFVQIVREMADQPRALQIAATLRRVGLPCVMTTLTTMAGFLALASSPMAVIRHLGIYAAIGVGAALIASLLLMVIALFGLPAKPSLPRHRWIEAILLAAQRALERRRIWVVALTLVITGLSTWGALTVKTDTYTIGYLPDDHWVVTHHDAIETRWGRYSVLDFFVRPKAGLAADSPEVLAGMERFIGTAAGHPSIRDGFSLADVYRRMSHVFAGPGAPAGRRGNALDADKVAQLRLVLEMQDLEWNRASPAYRDNFVAPLMTQDRKLGRLTLVGSMMSAQDLAALLRWLDRTAVETLGSVASVAPAGYPPLYVKIIDYVMTSQIRGFFIALAIIFVLMLVAFRSLRLALISLIPNTFPVLVMMGVMGAFGIDLDVATATVGAIVIGVSIDDTVHFLHHWKRAEREGLPWSACVEQTFRHAGVAALITTALLLVGYPVLLLADVATVVYFGLLTTIAAVAALYADLLILPLLLRWSRPSHWRRDGESP